MPPSIKKILFHLCCGPCSIYPIKELLKERFEVSGFFYNPNIHPRKEFEIRLESSKKLADMLGVNMIFHEEYTPKDFFDGLPSMKDSAEALASADTERCKHCYSIRLTATAKAAKDNGFDYFSTSLLYSRHQNHEEIISLARSIADEAGVSFFYEDFREGWQAGIDESKDMGLYRQKYCGCIFSLNERRQGGKSVTKFIAKGKGK